MTKRGGFLVKKLLSVLFALIICISVCACDEYYDAFMGITEGEEDEQNPANNKKDPVTIELGKTYTVEDYIEFTLFKITTTKKVAASMGDDIHFENQNANESYVDIVLDIKNISTDPLSSNDLLTASAEDKNSNHFANTLYGIETNDSTHISQYEQIASLSTARFHCALSLPDSSTELTVTLDINGDPFTLDYTFGEIVRNATALKEGDTVEVKDYATMTFGGIEYTDDLLPSNTSGAYSHYQIDDASNTYLVVKFDITNYQSIAKRESTFVGVTAQYMNKYSYTGFVVVEDSDQKGYSLYEDIEPLTTRKFCYLFEIPKTVIENEVALTIAFGGQEYTYNG